MTEFEIASLTARYVIGGGQVLIGLGQIAVVWYFGRQMVQANRDRAQAGERQVRSQSDLVERQERQAERRHTETMTALQAMIRNMDRQGRALETLIERTAEGRSA